jgi:putative PIN family toxin of toxin-antitoxin system
MRVVIDTNIVISRYITPHGNPAKILRHWEAETFTLLISDPILVEYRTVLGYERLRKLHQLSNDEIEEIIARFTNFAERVEVAETLRVIPEDPDDDKFLECAVVGGADYIVSGNTKHLGKLGSYEGIQILQPPHFLALLDREE